MPNGLKWTQELIDHIVLKWEKGFSASEIAKTIPGTNRNHIIGKLYRLRRVHDSIKTREIRPKAPKFNPKTYRKFAPPASTGSVAKEEEGRLSLAAPPPPPPPLPTKIGTFKGIVGALEVLQADECRWPLPEGPEKATAFCGHPVAPHQSYCPYHVTKAFNAY